MIQALFIMLVFGSTIIWFWAIIDITRCRFKKPGMRTVWLFSVLFFPLLGSILYFILKKKYTTKKPRKFQPNFHRITEKAM
ncbi:PLD nuclease N-terminal domain-containing protein [Mesonia aquimarina]|uniref:PLD nuclease N-terminal domain-containing protein n=1 Tax=Mesonia aquimarina TaxID=1504967 RepID=UPI000EF5D692|nr:PLD nuclease N-terminal domain-containing protein [Mesonia aquimarina]